ncbi:MAG: hypothetical protein UU85_C0001G0117 [Candidatus Wolfebacteria bacterium GW2011_GWA2_42_10]|uniref:DUF4145 domain-containing protein n=2 Tax=Candidatus Wolfeibacteriota TaxID=1752735 RepID=A0A0G0XMJ4_9BACT|nr:MAG: hypothetical protein UU38_C0003G0178 [Candidatus Wolfebacteria bacterium GW2011_GWB1_41_12]KKS25687.1 MAG: hypothetical protein UU85_C0001G0117 [Candidatus Wolfebacteria bacterium GW2011_GWA2_42_10]KKT56380.1 MAG: hypothetical protein UW50_C0002G0057 [Candidatus Wolfebacteria bacterium GW2011_GWA1_44_24]
MIRIIFYWIKENLLLLEIVSLIISGILLWLTVFLILKTQFIREKTHYFFDVIGEKNLTRRRSLKAWKQIQKRLEANDESNLKLAIIEADKILDEILKMSGYRGDTMADRLKQINPSQLSNIEEIWQAHKIRNRIVHEPDFHIPRGEAWMVVEIYKKALQQFGLID